MSVHVYQHSFWTTTTAPELLKSRFQPILEESGFTILNFMEHHFEPVGYTAIWLLGESHLAIHTFPEDGKAFIEISSCSRDIYFKFLELTEAQIPIIV